VNDYFLLANFAVFQLGHNGLKYSLFKPQNLLDNGV
jgi:hypothetical protein